MILAAIWQGKNNPPFSLYMHAFGEEMCKIYEEGFLVSPPGVSTPMTVKLGVLLAGLGLGLGVTCNNGSQG